MAALHIYSSEHHAAASCIQYAKNERSSYVMKTTVAIFRKDVFPSSPVVFVFPSWLSSPPLGTIMSAKTFMPNSCVLKNHEANFSGLPRGTSLVHLYLFNTCFMSPESVPKPVRAIKLERGVRLDPALREATATKRSRDLLDITVPEKFSSRGDPRALS